MKIVEIQNVRCMKAVLVANHIPKIVQTIFISLHYRVVLRHRRSVRGAYSTRPRSPAAVMVLIINLTACVLIAEKAVSTMKVL